MKVYLHSDHLKLLLIPDLSEKQRTKRSVTLQPPVYCGPTERDDSQTCQVRKEPIAPSSYNHVYIVAEPNGTIPNPLRETENQSLITVEQLV